MLTRKRPVYLKSGMIAVTSSYMGGRGASGLKSENSLGFLIN